MLQHGQVRYITDDDPDRGLETNWVGDWADSAEDLYHCLREIDWPTRDLDVRCMECKDVEVYLGDVCPDCSKRLTGEIRGDNVYDIRVGK